jgi:hypothetical protein
LTELSWESPLSVSCLLLGLISLHAWTDGNGYGPSPFFSVYRLLGTQSSLTFVVVQFPRSESLPGRRITSSSLSRLLSVLSSPTKSIAHRNNQTAVYVLGPLAFGTNYVTPQKNDTTAKNCDCNSVIYSLYAACSACQFNSSYTAVT